MDSNYKHAEPHAWGECAVIISRMSMRCDVKNSQILAIFVWSFPEPVFKEETSKMKGNVVALIIT